MTNLVFPTLRGLEWGVVRAPNWKTRMLESAAGNEVRVSLMSYPRYTWNLKFSVLRSDAAYGELQTLLGFINNMGGMGQTFLYKDDTDNSATAQLIGIGNGTIKTFQLVRSFGSFIEPVQSPDSVISIFDNGTLIAPANYTVGSTGIVSFITAPASGRNITWSGTFKFMCRFEQDSYDFEHFMRNFWQQKKLDFKSIKQ